MISDQLRTTPKTRAVLLRPKHISPVCIVIAIGAMLGLSSSASACRTWPPELYGLVGDVYEYALAHGEFPATTESETWFQQLVADDPALPSELRFGVTSDGAFPLDPFGYPLVLEVAGDGLTAGIRSVGRNGVDDHGDGDDYDSRRGSNSGYWEKSDWPAARRTLGIAVLLSAAAVVWILIRKRESRWSTHAAFLAWGIGVGVVPAFCPLCSYMSTTAESDPPEVMLIMSLSLLVALITAVAGGISVLIALFERSRPDGCQQCGYSLQGLTRQRCPECGLEFSNVASHDHDDHTPQRPLSPRGVDSPGF